jgi:type I restriction enzyme S subunit
MEVIKGYKQPNKKRIPEDWVESPIGEEIDLLTGYPFQSNRYAKSGIRLLRGSNVKRGITDWSNDITQYWEKLTADIKEYSLKEGDIVIAMDGSLVGRSFARLTKADLPALLLQRVARIRTKNIDAGYLKEFICSDYFTKHCDAVKTSSAIPHISPNDIRSFIIPIPPTIEEQIEIASALSDADALISNLEKLIAKKRNIKQGAMQQLLQPKERWEVKKLGEVADCLDYLRVPLNDSQRKSMKGDIPYCGANGIVDYVNNYVVDDDIILMAEDGGYFDEFKTRPIAYRMSGKCWVNNHAHILKAKANNDQGFLFFSLVHKNIMDYINGGTRAKLNKGELLNIPLNIPNEKVMQSSISIILSEMDSEIETLEAKLVKCKQIKQGMMQQLLTGKIRLV